MVLADVFISYARTDAEIAGRLARELEARGLSVWHDNKISGGSKLSEVIEREIAAASKVIVLWSAEAVKSEWVRDEASIAKEGGKLLPLSIDGSKPPIGFRQTQTIDLEDWARGKAKALPAALLPDLTPGGDPKTPTQAPVDFAGPRRRTTRAVAGGSRCDAAGARHRRIPGILAGGRWRLGG